MKSLGIIFGALLLATTANAAIDLRSTITGPSLGAVDVNGQYQVSVRSAGTTTQLNAIVQVYLPLGAEASGLASGCTVNAKSVLKCVIGTMTQGAVYNTSFSLKSSAPISNWRLKSVASGQLAETSPANNESVVLLSLTAPAQNLINIQGPVAAHSDLCVFASPLTPNFALCDHTNSVNVNWVLDANQNVLLNGAIRGTYSQPTQEQFQMIIGVATYSGYSISPKCFAGIVTYSNNPNSQGAFQLCLRN